jgi:hypothetical protein
VQEREGNTLELITIGYDFLNRTQMAQHQREGINKYNDIKLKSFFTTEEMITKLKSLSTE